MNQKNQTKPENVVGEQQQRSLRGIDTHYSIANTDLVRIFQRNRHGAKSLITAQ